jgi:hypothetical protein
VAGEADPHEFKWRYLLIALLPPLVFLVNLLLLTFYGDPWDVLPAKIAAFDAYKEGAARIGTIAAFMLLFGAALAGVLFFAVALRLVERRLWRSMAVAWLVLAGAAILGQALIQDRQAEDYAGFSLFCLASGYSEARTDEARAVVEAEVAAEQRRAAAGGSESARQGKRGCDSDRFQLMRQLAQWQSRLVALAFAGLVLGGIFCLAGPLAAPRVTAKPLGAKAGVEAQAASDGESAGGDDPELEHWERQSERLNACLYLAALLLGTALLFINAFLRWPAFLLTDSKSYDGYIASMVAYYGFTFSVMLASFYMPVALLLAGKARTSARRTGAAVKLPEAFKGPLQILKIVLGLFSTALAGILPGIIDLAG